MMPVIIYNLLSSIKILSNAIGAFGSRCVKGITANRKRCAQYMKESVGLATVLNPYIGYKKAAVLAKEAEMTGKNIYELALEKKILAQDKLNELLG